MSALLLVALPALFWFGFFANPALVPDSELERTPVGFIHYDVYRLYYPSLHGYFGMLRGGTLPLWDPYRAVGFPAMGSHLFGIFYPLNFPFLFLGVGAALTVTCLLHFAIALWGTYRLVRGLGLARPAAGLGAVVYAFSGLLVFALWHPSLFQALASVPLLFALGDRWARNGGWDRMALLALGVGIQSLAGFLQGTLYAVYLLVPFLVWRAVARIGWRGFLRERVPAGLVAGALALGIAAVILLPAAELSCRSLRPPGGLTLAETQPVRPLGLGEYLATLLDPLNRPTEPDPRRRVGEYYFRGYPYLGTSILILAVLGPLVTRRRGIAVFFGAAALVSILLAVGENAPLFPLFHRYGPGGDMFRYPRRFLALTALCAAVLVALGADGLWRTSAADRRRRLRLRLVVPAVAGLWIAAAVAMRARGQLDPASLPPAVALILAGAGGGLALLVPAGPRLRAAIAAIALLIVTTDIFFRNRNFVLHPSADPAPFSALAEGRRFLREHAGHDRVYLQRGGGRLYNHLPAKIGLLDGYLACMDYEAMTLERYARFTYLLSHGADDPPVGFSGNHPLVLSESTYRNSRLFDYMGVKYLAVEKDTRRDEELAALPAKTGPGLLLRPAFTDSEMAVYENPHRLARARFTPRYRLEPGEHGRRALAALLDPALDPLRTVVLEEPPPPGPWTAVQASSAGDPARVAIVHYAPDRVEIDCWAPSAGFVVLTDQHYP
ncbi:MAG: hypothetical protein JXQ29_09385, partial [Planctomycetes bacterium]|nr:hypothetical protein [Planctomycetota bacterium]